MIGQTISHYTIIEKLGEGGMGIVYKAEDTKLKRTVALKFLPDRVNKDGAAKARFLQEAQAAAGLNHPNICTIHGVEDVDGSLFMVMEYIEGGTLGDKLPYQNAKDAVTIASQIGEAMQEAHTKGIVHRDIKADNVMLTSRGQVKVMDFGLAKLKGALKLTRTSSTVGTLAYMAPEQIQGGEVDHRSDIFSFGVLLFEMLTGKLPFRGEHEAAMVYSIVNEDPQDVGTLVPDLSPLVVNLIQRCLEKDPADRYQTMQDAVSELRRSQKKSSRVMRSSAHVPPFSADAPPSSAEIPTSPAPSASGNRKPAILIGVAIAAVAIVTLALWFMSGPSLPELNPNMEVSNLQIPASEYQYPGISPDGKWLTFPGSDLNGKWDIYMMFIETGENKRVTTDSTLSVSNAVTARFSPDGSSIAYGRRRQGTEVSEVCVVSVLSGLVRVIADTGIYPQWSPAGDRIYYYRGHADADFPSRSGWREYWSASPQGGDTRIEFIDSLMQGPLTKFTFCVSPDGKRVVFTRPLAIGHNEIFIRHLKTGEETQLTADKKVVDEVVWADNGLMFYTSNKSGNYNIWVIPESGGEAKQVTRGAGPDYGISVSTAANRMVFSQRTEVATLWMVNTDGTGHRQVYPDENIMQSHIAPDGNTIVLEISHPTLRQTLMLREISGGRQEILFPFDSATGRFYSQWSPSGNALSYIEYRTGTLHIDAKILDLAGGRRVRDLGEGGVYHWVSDSVVMIWRNSAADDDRPNYSSVRTLNLNTLEESVFFRDTVLALPVMDNTAILYESDGEWRYLPMPEYRRDPLTEGRSILGTSEISDDMALTSNSWLYFRSANTGALWRLDYRTFKRSKILDIPLSINIRIGMPDYNDNVVPYSIIRLKTNIVKIDNVFGD
jgi:serine/threonine protein kinase